MAREIVIFIYESFFQRRKMKGRRDVAFFDKINGIFICLVAAAIQHCLKEWQYGKVPTEVVDFKFENAAGRSSIGPRKTGG